MTTEPYIYIWEYLVSPAADHEFRRYYGPTDEWVQLFRRAPGYLSTQLYQDRQRSNRYITVDTWESEEAFREFRARYASQFEHLDSMCEAFTLKEKPHGEFTHVPALSRDGRGNTNI
jgi:heme-degrading monooxygenase HmoA